MVWRIPSSVRSVRNSILTNSPHPGGVDHPIFTESIRRIREALADPAAPAPWREAAQRWADGPERDVLERCIHSSGDLAIAPDLVFVPALGAGESGAAELGAAGLGMAALAAGAPILTDTAMAAAAVAPMARRTFGNPVHCLLDWAPEQAPPGDTRSAAAVRAAWQHLTATPGVLRQPGSRANAQADPPAPVVLIGSAPTALERLLELVAAEGVAAQADPAARAPLAMRAPSLVIGMPVGFVGVAESKRRLAASGLAHIRLEGSKGGAGLVAAACNALLRAAWLQAASPPRG